MLFFTSILLSCLYSLLSSPIILSSFLNNLAP